jgi:DNA-directed RNA polymerase subunit RPC12/RpoP
MTSTFLHKDKHVPPDELIERDAPTCTVCGHKMSLVRVDTVLSDAGTKSKREYECTRCGAKQSQKTASEEIKPFAS